MPGQPDFRQSLLIKELKRRITTETDGALLDVLLAVLVLLPLDLGELVREGVPLDAALGGAAVVVADGAALLDDAQVVVVASGPSRLKEERVHDAALEKDRREINVRPLGLLKFQPHFVGRQQFCWKMSRFV